MIESLTVKDFQAHAKRRIAFDPGVTTIVGSTDAGKSALIRALRWLATNRPGGEAFIRDGAGPAKVTLKIDGHTIKRVRGSRRNTYQLDGETLKAFGNEVPEAVGKLLNLGELNFQAQHDGPFWFSQSPGEVSRQLNQIVDLGVIDDVMTYLTQQGRAAAAVVQVCADRLAEAETERKQAKSVKREDRDLRAVEELAKAAKIDREQAEWLESLLRDVRKFKATVDLAARTAGQAAAAVAAGSQWAERAGEATALRALLFDVKRTGDRVIQTRDDAREAATAFETMLGGLDLCPLCLQPLKS